MDNIELSLFSSRIASVCDEMGAVLQRVAFSPNIKDRLDYSCAIFDANGALCAQAAHIPVHLGSMAYAMADIVDAIDWSAGDMVMMNDPYLGGTHLPDVTVIAPLFVDNELVSFVVNRAHHADMGAETPGSMPVSSSLHEEGVVIAPTKLVVNGQLQQAEFSMLLAQFNNAKESSGDFNAQISANRCGLERLQQLVETTGVRSYSKGLVALNQYAAKLAKQVINKIPDGEYRFTDFMDDDGQGEKNIRIQLALNVNAGEIVADFSGSHPQVRGNINCPVSVVAAAVYYVFRCLMPAQMPACAGAFQSINIKVPDHCLLNASYPAAVAAGNVETSTRVVDVVMGALAQAVPELMPAASQGSMNNLAMGHAGDGQQSAWNYYETIGGGMGAGQLGDGLSAVQTHMTNTLNTPIEVLESHYPLRVLRYQVRKQSGGNGDHRGGDGIIREYQFLSAAHFTLLTERRSTQPWASGQAEPGRAGKNLLNDKRLAAKISSAVKEGDVLRVETPGGGGWSA